MKDGHKLKFPTNCRISSQENAYDVLTVLHFILNIGINENPNTLSLMFAPTIRVVYITEITNNNQPQYIAYKFQFEKHLGSVEIAHPCFKRV